MKKNKLQKICRSEQDLKNFSEYELQNEEAIRKRWLISFFIVSLAWIVTFFSEFTGEHGLISEISDKTGVAFSVLVSLLSSAIHCGPWIWFSYHCAYKKRGTGLLLWTLIVLPLNEVLAVTMGELNVGEWSGLNWISYLIPLAITIYYWFNCLTLRSVNLNRKKVLDEACFRDSCSQYVTEMSNSSCVENLKKMYNASLQKWPYWEKRFTKVYNDRKYILLKNL